MTRKENGIKAAATYLAMATLFLLSACGKGNALSAQSPAMETPEGEQAEICAAENIGSVEPKQLPLPSQFPDAVAGDGSAIYHIGRQEEDLVIHTLDTVSGQWTEFAKKTEVMDGISYVYGAVSGDRLMAILENERREFTMLSFNTSTGELENTANLSEIDGFLNGCLGYDDGLICYRSGEGTAYFYSTNGQFLNKVNFNGAALSSISITDGTPVACLWKDGSYFLCTMDQNGLGQRTEIDTRISVPCVSHSKYLADYGVLYRLDEADNRLEPALYWEDSGLVFTPSVVLIDQSGIAVIYDEIRGCVFIMSTQTASSRKVLTIGAMQYGAELTQAISIFNSQNQEYVARVKLYSLDEKDRFLVDIGSGSELDIICTGLHPGGENLPYSTLDSGAFEDLLPYIDSDPELSREDLLPELLKELTSEDGHLYELFSRFSVSSLVTSTDIAAEVSGPAELLALSRELPQGYALLGGMSKNMLMDHICQIASAQCINYETGTCDFSRGNFPQWLELYNHFQPYDQSTHDGYLIALSEAVSPYAAANYRRLFGEDYQYMAWPNESETLLPLSGVGGGYCILSSSQNKEAAWQVLRTMLLPEGQNMSGAIGFPVIKTHLQPGLKALMDDNTNEVDITQVDIDKIMALLGREMSAVRSTEASDIIIKDEIQRYAAGQKTLDDTVAAIQSRVSIYLAEQFG